MKKYIGTKQIKARPMTRAEYNIYRGWELPAEEDGTEEVYLVEYTADEKSKPNHPDHEGYISMSPKHVFDKAYRIAETFPDRLLIETQNLANKTNLLNNFMCTQGFVDLDRENKNLLYKQSRLMNEYLQILGQRLELLGEKFKNNE